MLPINDKKTNTCIQIKKQLKTRKYGNFSINLLERKSFKRICKKEFVFSCSKQIIYISKKTSNLTDTFITSAIFLHFE